MIQSSLGVRDVRIKWVVCVGLVYSLWGLLILVRGVFGEIGFGSRRGSDGFRVQGDRNREIWIQFSKVTLFLSFY